MDPEEILKLAANPNHIPGIYNYCDRWCERCEKTSCCLNHELSSYHEKKLADLDVSNKEFWDEMSNIFSSTMNLIKYISEKNGIDLNNADHEVVEQEIKIRDDAYKLTEQHPILIDANKYMKMVDEFFEQNEEIFYQKEKDLNTQLELAIDEKKILDEADEIKDIFEIISWYNTQIFVKMSRAISGKYVDEIEEDEDGYPKDSDGSTKVALIGIDRSISAWGRMYEKFPEKRDGIISILLHLDTLRRQIEQLFPDARNFKRAGFDD